MCGISGIWNIDGDAVSLAAVQRAAKMLRHRGPDDEGYLLANTRNGLREERRGEDTVSTRPLPFITESANQRFDLAFGSRRLSIIDLSPAGHQPMCNEDGTIWLVYNGEIYNYRGLRDELQAKGHRFRSNTDTEVIIHAYEAWGPGCLNRFNGMWAFALLDWRSRKLFCSRDRFGVKPFYYFHHNRTFAFASEIKALLALDVLPREPNHEIIYDYLAHGLVDHTSATFFAHIRKLSGGHYLEWRLGDRAPGIHRYYDLPRNGEAIGHSEEFEKRFYVLFQDSVQLRLISDVPVGTCLSGGLDSSSIVGMVDKLMRETGLKLPGGETIQQTFSARYTDKRYDEGPFIDAVVKQTGVAAHFTYPVASDLAEHLEDLIYCQEEPFVSSSVYAQWKVFELAKQGGVKVALDGQGADELFAGYPTSFPALFAQLISKGHWLELTHEYRAHARLRGKAAPRDLLTALGFAVPELLKALIRPIKRAVEGNGGIGNPMSAEFAAPFRNRAATKTKEARPMARSLDRYLYDGLVFAWLPSYLRYEDKNSMAHSIESRLPFLDYRLVEFAFSLPWRQKIYDGVTKFILRNAMKEILPEVISKRHGKIGFTTPEDVWLREDMKDVISQIINSDRFLGRPFWNADSVKATVRRHQSGQANISWAIWRWVNLELWMRKFIDGNPEWARGTAMGALIPEVSAGGNAADAADAEVAASGVEIRKGRRSLPR